MEARDEETTGKSQGSHQPAGSAVMESGDGPALEPASVACRNRVCRMFGQLVTPEPPRGVCPHCKTALPGSTLSRKTPPVDKSKVKQLAERYKSDYKAATQSLVTTCEQLATVTERLEKVKAGSVEHQRLFQMWQTLTDRLESSRPEARASSSGAQVVIFRLPDNERDLHLAPLDPTPEQREPDAAGPTREAQPTAQPAASAAATAPGERLTTAIIINDRHTQDEPPPPPPRPIWIVLLTGGPPVEILEDEFDPTRHRRIA